MSNKTKKKNKKVTKNSEDRVICYIVGVILILLIMIAIFRLGAVGMFISNSSKYLFGDYYFITFVSILISSLYFLFFRDKTNASLKNILAFVILNIVVFLLPISINTSFVGFDVLKDYINLTSEFFKDPSINMYGGLIGAFLYSISSLLFAKFGTYLLIAALICISLLLIVPISTYNEIFLSFKRVFNRPKKSKPIKTFENASSFDDVKVTLPKPVKSKFITLDDLDNKVEVKEEIKDKINVSSNTEIEDIVKKNSTYKLPPFSLLEPVQINNKNNVNLQAAAVKGEKVIEILANFGVKAELLQTHIGPSVTQFEIKPDSSVKVNKINNIQDNIKMELAARDIRIEAPIPGRNAVGIEIPNVESVPVKMLELVKSIPLDKKDKKLLFILGKDLMGKPVYCQLDKMPHLLIAGATGSGKSVCMNTIITSFLLRTTPDEVKLLLIDPKKVEFTPYHKVPHLIGPVISDAQEAARALKVIVVMMENRFEIFSKCGVRNIQAYNDKVKEFKDEKMEPMPYVVVIIDELADLMSVAGKEVELSIQRITQLARASGIHLIVATQRPSTDVITGIIKSNIPSRISFSVASGIDSRTILDHTGAERLLGNGDMLYLPIGEPSTIRLQGVYVTDNEVKRICEYCSNQGVPKFDDAFIRLEGVDNNEQTAVIGAQDDPLYDEVKEYVIDAQKASTSLLQRRFGIGYNRAARMIDLLESKGIIGPAQGSKPREVYIKKEE